MDARGDDAGRWADLDPLLLRGGHLTGPDFEPGEDVKTCLHDMVHVLVIGAGGLGCELLKDLGASPLHHSSPLTCSRLHPDTPAHHQHTAGYGDGPLFLLHVFRSPTEKGQGPRGAHLLRSRARPLTPPSPPRSIRRPPPAARSPVGDQEHRRHRHGHHRREQPQPPVPVPPA